MLASNNVSSTAQAQSVSPVLKMERRDSSNSESSLEHLDLGRTPKKLKKTQHNSVATSTPVVPYQNGLSSSHNNKPLPAIAEDAPIDSPASLTKKHLLKQRLQQHQQTNGDEAKDYEEEDADDDEDDQMHEIKSSPQRSQRHHKRRSLGRSLDKRTSVLLEYNADNPNSLRKKFRFNRSHSASETAATSLNSLNTNESGFIDASSQFLNASAATSDKTQIPANSPHCSASGTASHSSSASSSAATSPHGAGEAFISSPESGIGEREDMKYVCPICDVVSATPHEFTNHIRCHNYSSGDTENFTCRICSKVLSSASSLDRHVLVHTGERPFNCKYCHLTFTTNGNMHRHMRTHKQHQHNHHRRNSNGTNKNNNNNNNTTHTTTAAATSNAISAITNNDNGNALNAQLSNEFGAETDKSTRSLNDTAAAAGDVAATNMNGKRLNGGAGVESCESDGGCSSDSSNNSANTQHSLNNNNNNNSTKYNNNNNIKRKNCEELSSSIENTTEADLLKRRLKTTINNNILGTEPMIDVTSKSCLSCPVCSATDFDNMLALGAHMDSSHGDIPAKCRHCDVVFRTHRQLNVHPCTQKPLQGLKGLQPYADCSAGKKRWECKRCTGFFNSSEDLENHMLDCGDFSKEVTCDEAQQIFNTAQIYKQVAAASAALKQKRRLSESFLPEDCEDQQHREDFFRHLYLKNKSYQISTENQLDDECIKSEPADEAERMTSTPHQDSKDLADIQSILNMTSSSSTSNFLKNFEQSVNTPSSNYSFDKDEEEAQDAFTAEFRKMKLRGEFPCKLCTSIYPNLRALKGHNRIHLSAAGPNGPFRCNMCPYSTNDKAVLVRHMRTHNGDRPYECAVCNYAFTTKANCERHLRNRHAKTTREEVKRAIIYHPSEDTSCEDTSKKLHQFSSASTDFEDDCDLYSQQLQPKDRSTPVSHLKEMLTSGASSSIYEENSSNLKPMKIQVKSLEQLLDKSSASSEHLEMRSPKTAHNTQALTAVNAAPMDLSMDVLDLSKKPSTSTVPAASKQEKLLSAPVVDSTANLITPNIDLTSLEKNQQLLLTQQQIMQEIFPKLVDPAAQYSLQQLYRNLMFPLNPFLLQNSFLPSNLGDLQTFAPLMRSMFGSAVNGITPNLSEVASSAPNSTNANANLLPQMSPLLGDNKNNSNNISAIGLSTSSLLPPSNTASVSSMPSRHAAAAAQLPASLHTSHHQMLPGGPVKMVIKNGVLMPKQKQRRYRTERPFACEHCSARFTLRSNMERHVKQQHPQFYAQRQRSGHHIMRGRGASSAASMNSITHLQAALAAQAQNGNGTSPISDQVKYAILAQQLKARKDTDLLHQALAHGSTSVNGSNTASLLSNAAFAGYGHATHNINSNSNGALEEEDEPKLIIDEDEEEDVEPEEDFEIEEMPNEDEDEDEDEELPLEPEVSLRVEEQLPKSVEDIKPSSEASNDAAKKTAETILEQVIKAGSSSTGQLVKPEAPAAPGPNSSLKSMMAQAESVGKFLKEVASSSFKDESQDLVPVSKLVDNATNNSVSFNTYFRPAQNSDVANHMEQSDEEGLVASGSASESNNSGTEDHAAPIETKKKSAYSLAPNRVSCPYCQRMFPWSSSLRRHILTHTGQKPFKCSHCPLLFTTKSNCDRHLLRKHGNVESAVSVYVPTEDVNEPIPVPKSVEEIEQQQRQKEEEERQRKKAVEEAKKEKERKEREEDERVKQQLQEQQLFKQLQAQFSAVAAAAAANSPRTSEVSSSELPYKCHLCESSFAERFQCLEHLKLHHAQEFALLYAKGAIDSEAEAHNQAAVVAAEEEEQRMRNGGSTSGKYPDYSNRKVICAFCVRRFWSTEDLRRHMRTHSGERPFQCEICLRKFTLKHSMLRHMKKHNGRNNLNGTGGNSEELSTAGNSGSDFSDDEPTTISATSATVSQLAAAAALSMRAPKIQELLNKANEWRNSRLSCSAEQKENIAEDHNHQSDLIGNLLGISDQGILNKLLSSADEAAKFLGVENKH